MEVKILFDVFEHGNGKINEFMHAADVFEESKQLAEHNQFDIVCQTEGDIKYDLLIKEMVKAFNEAGRNIIFLSIRKINGLLVNEFAPYIKEGVKSISTGKKWGVFKNMLETLDYEVETTETMVVKSAKLKI